MEIGTELARRLVEIIIPVVHRNVNLMDLRGVIIASGHTHRIGTVHTGARLAIENGETIEIYPDELDRYPGALQGINMPIFRDSRPVGVVGVFGNPPSVRSTAQLVKMITELVLEREALQRESGVNRRMREELMRLVAMHEGTTLPAAAIRLARSLGFDVERTRAVALLRAAGSVRPDADAAVVSLDGLPLPELEARLARDGFLRPDDFLALVDGEVAVLLVAEDETASRVRAIRRTLAELTGLMVRAGLGGSAVPGRFPASWQQARFALDHASARRPLRSLEEESLLTEYLRSRLMIDDGTIAAGPVTVRLDAAFRRRPQLRTTVEALLHENLDGKATAAALGIHRNTLAYRLRQLQELTGLRPDRRFPDAILCWIALGAAPPGDAGLTSPAGAAARRRTRTTDRPSGASAGPRD